MVFSPEMFSPYFGDKWTAKYFNANNGGGDDSSSTSNKSDHDAIYKHLQNSRQNPFKANPLRTSHC